MESNTPKPTARRTTRRAIYQSTRLPAWRAAALGLAICMGAGARAQFVENPVYLDDSTTAGATLERLNELIARGSTGEAVRALQQLLDEESGRLLPSARDAEVFVSVRRRVHETLLARPELLARYREAQEPIAANRLSSGHHDEVERARLLTASGFEAALRVAQLHLEAARFNAARRTLEQLEDHPDRTGPGADDAADLAVLVARYANDADSRALAVRWAAQAGRGAPAADPVTPPRATRAPVANAASGGAGWTGEPIRIDSVLTDPLQSVALTAGDAQEYAPRGNMGRPSAWTLPAIAGDLLYLNDGETVSAWDRFTFRPVWRAHTIDDRDAPPLEAVLRARRDSLGRNLEDPTTVTIHADTLLCVTGRANAGERRGDPRLHAIDRHTGERLWSVDPEAIDSSLIGGSIRGPVIVSDGVVVVAVRKMLRRRRLMSVLLVGLDLASGETRWVRQIASAGSLPFQQYSPLPVGLAERGGVVFVTDVLGAAGAVEAATGRVRWVTRLGSDPISSNRARSVWTSSDPVPLGDAVVLIGPDGKRVLRMDAATGETLGSRAAKDFGEPTYLLRVGPWLAAVGLQSVAFVRAQELETGEVRQSPRVPEPGIRGRAVVAGDTLALPVADGLLLIDPASEKASPRSVVPLTESGNTLVLDGQVVVVDESSAYNFLSWGVASTLLERRLTDEPGDPGPALIYAELAFRAGKTGKLIEIADRAIAAVNSLTPEAGQVAGDRLFEALAMMAAPVPTHEAWAAAIDSVEDAPVIRDAAVIEQLLDRLGRLARTPAQRVVHLLGRGDFDERRGETVPALEAYQRVLTEPRLAMAEWRGGQLSVRARLEAQRRLEALLRTHGLGAYEAFERAAQAEADAADPANVGQLEAVASRYPAASVTPGLWLGAGLRRLADDQDAQAARDFRAGLAVVARRRAAGATSDPASVAELIGQLTRLLARRDQIGSAAETLALAATYGVTPTLGGEPAGFGDAIARHTSRVDPPRIGTRLTDEVSLLPGEPLVPLLVTPGTPRQRVLLVSPVAGTVMLAEPHEPAKPGELGGELSVRWSRPIARAVPIVLRSDADRVVLLHPRLNPGSGGTIESIDAATGEALWRSIAFDDAVRGAAPGRGGRVTMPTGDQIAMQQVLVLVEDTTAVLLERSGRAVAYDLTRGTVTWAAALGVGSVVDAAMTDGVLIVGGVNSQDGPMGSIPTLVSVDARTGDVLQRIDGLVTPIRWIREVGRGLAAVGLRGSVFVLDLREGQPRWTDSSEMLHDSLDAWSQDETLVVASDQGSLWMVDSRTGRLRSEPLETMGRLAEWGGQLRVGVSGGLSVLSTDRGVAVFDETGELVGLDPFDGQTELLPAAIGSGALATVSVTSERGTQPELAVHLLEASTCRLLDTRRITIPGELRTTPTSVHAIDGAVLIGFGSATLVVRTAED
ncbi:MAG: outer membrane protein assembly factor BamB [Phycisphaerales bacterium]|jgi:outer membrane protein assembly factor BamB